MTYRRLFVGIAAALFVALSSPVLAVELTVSAAISMKAPLDELAKRYEKVSGDKLILTYGASGALQQQIVNGAPVDLFIAAADKPMDDLQEKKLLLDGTRRELARNRLLLIAPKSSGLGLKSFEDLRTPRVKRIAIGEAKTVPAGQYAEEVLAKLGLADAVRSRLVYGNNVRQVLTYVENGDVDAGFVYATDARGSDKVVAVAIADEAWHAPIVYPLAIVKATKHPEAARRLAAFLTAPEAQSMLQNHGFITGRGPS